MTATKSATRPTEKITRDDLEAKFRGLQEGVKGSVESKKQALITAGAIGTVIVLALVFLLGKRSGKKKKTLVEIRRL